MTTLPSADEPATWPIVALPVSSPWPIVRVAPDGNVAQFGALPAPLNALVRCDPSGRLWSLDPTAATVTGYALDGDDVREVVVHALPDHFETADMAVDERHVYLGGKAAWGIPEIDEALRRSKAGLPFNDGYDQPKVWFRGALDGPAWSALALPPLPAVMRRFLSQKAVDALVLDGDRLVAVDDVVLPKWFFLFDRVAEGGPAHVGTVDLSHGPNESTLHGAARSSQWIALRSGGATRMGEYRRVRIYARGSLEARASLSERLDRRSGTRKEDPWGGAAFVGEHLLVATLSDRLLEIDCTRLDAPPGRDPGPIDLGERAARVKIAGSASVLDVIPVDAWGGALVIVEETGGQRRAVWHRVGDARR
ncbi:MAG: hypothetical protein Q8S73_03235 [Deltaproteobacteria bacterium]|nr:hypothetical protein [Myxococcales bacterium]MDP3213093.1 hypothetical protein [Deltaproteobacteria bacterium]